MKITVFFAVLFLLNLFVCCHTYDQYPLPDIEDAKFIEDCVRVHNEFRSKVNPPASNMLRMSWDPALAKSAKVWAKKCMFEHNIYLKIPQKVHPTFTPIGENIWTGTATVFSVRLALTDWFNEVSNYDFNTRRCTGKCGHYTQVVWATSYKVGCAVHFCHRIYNLQGFNNVAHFVCDYGPAGNYPTKPYKAGQPCSECRNDQCVDNLCVNAEREKLISYANWYPDWDTQPQPPQSRPPQPPVPRPPAPRPPAPRPPAHTPPAGQLHSYCDHYCVAVLILRPLFLVLCPVGVLLAQRWFPHMFIYV
ncbi:glioma pathogenesis-related protein 1-like [Coturnix japonica]|uniref:Glioma pathogenesis-related protein 1-like n=1 Tax=Coturnix japonica TaxID=93934 RepID=A0A8C2U079_COTJA|nr:glioma pathogenesis-related protein 1-like [Coturnix japonica]